MLRGYGRNRVVRGPWWVAAAALGLLLSIQALAVRAAGPDPYLGARDLELYSVEVDRGSVEKLIVGGFDLVGLEPVDGEQGARDGELRASLVLSEADRQRLVAQGIVPRLVRVEGGQTFTQWSDAQQQAGYTVWRPYDGETGILAELNALAAAHPEIVERVVVGTTVQGREIVALRVTKDANTVPQGTRPTVLYNALQHAREWIAVEVNRRLMRHMVEGYGQDPKVTGLVDSIELWFIVVANPDGYQHTFTDGQRLWRKNLRDNNGDGQITGNADGVDINRNFEARWNYDIEGSSGGAGGQTYRGPSAASEPETQALQDLTERMHFRYLINYHSAAELLLYPDGWQDQTRVADDPIFSALAGDFFKPAIEGFHPMLSAGLYITNGETCDFAHGRAAALCYTPELSTPPEGSVPPGSSGFEFPDDEALIQAEFEKNLPFAMDIAASTARPDQPVSHLGNVAPPMTVDAFAKSYGDPQPVQANVARRLGDVTMAYRVNEGPVVEVPAGEWNGGERYGDTGDVYYHRVRGTVSGARPGDTVRVWFKAGGVESEPFSYTLERDTGAPVLVVAAEDYTGTAPTYAQTDGPSYLDYVTEALVAGDYSFDVYDFDAQARTSPSHLGVLAHYRAVVWSTGDDQAVRTAEMANGTTSREMRDMMLAMRGYLNEGGKLFLTGKYAGTPYFQGLEYDPVADTPCDPGSGADGCEPLSNDFFQYYLGAWNYSNVTGLEGAKVVGTAPPFADFSFDLGGAGAAAVDHGATFGVTSEAMPVDDYPQFASQAVAQLQNAGIKPRTGEHYLASGATTYEYQRLGRIVDLRDARSARLEFWAARDMRPTFDALFVEARVPQPERPDAARLFLPALHNGAVPEGAPELPPAASGWTTLPDANGHSSPEQALTCYSEAWYVLHPQLVHYMTPDDDEDYDGCRPTGSSGEWHAASGPGAGWEHWSIDLSRFAGEEIELHISHLTSRLAFPGVWIDDVELFVDDQRESYTSFEDDLGTWAVSGMDINVSVGGAPPPKPHAVDFTRMTAAQLPPVDGSPIVTTEDTVFLGIGFEVIAQEADRAAVMRRALEHLGVAP